MRRAEKLTPSCADFLEIWETLNLLEHSWPVQACNGIALPLYASNVLNVSLASQLPTPPDNI